MRLSRPSFLYPSRLGLERPFTECSSQTTVPDLLVSAPPPFQLVRGLNASWHFAVRKFKPILLFIDSFEISVDKLDHYHTPSITSHTLAGRICVLSNGVVLGYVAPDPNYCTPLLVPDAASALHVSFTLRKRATSGRRIQLKQIVSFQCISPVLLLSFLDRTISGVRY